MDYNEAIYETMQIHQLIIYLKGARLNQNKEMEDKYLKILQKKIDYLSSIIN